MEKELAGTNLQALSAACTILELNPGIVVSFAVNKLYAVLPTYDIAGTATATNFVFYDGLYGFRVFSRTGF